LLGDTDANIEVVVFDEALQTKLIALRGPSVFMFRIKSTAKKMAEGMLVSHIVSNVL
jgi:hypothetical protein